MNRLSPSTRVLALLLALLVPFGTAPVALQAATIYWDGTSNDWSAVGSWDTAVDGTGGDPGAVPGASDVANFSINTINTAQTVNLNGNQSALGLIFLGTNTATTQLLGGGTDRTLTLGASGITVDSLAGAVTIGSATAGQNVGIILSGAQTWTNNSANLLTIENAVDAASFALTFAGSGNTTLNSALINGAALIKNDAGTLTLAGTNAFTSATINGGTIAAGTLTLSAGATALTSSATSAVNSDVTISTAAGTITSSAGTLTLGGTLNAGSLALTFAGAGDTTVSNAITSGTTLTKNGGGTLTLVGDNTYAGATNINVGTLKLGAAGGATNTALGTIAAGTFVTATGGALDLNGFTLGTAEALSIIGTGVSTTGALTNSGAAATYAGVVTIGTGGASIGGSGNITLSAGLATNANALTKVGAGTLTLSALSSRTGTVTISEGTLKVGASGAMGTATTAVTVSSTGALDLNGVNYALASALSLSGTGVGSTGALTNSGAAATYAGIVTISAAATSIGGSGDITLSAALATTAHSFVKTGAGTLVLTTNSLRTGATSIDQGTLRLQNATALGTTATVITLNGGNLDLRQPAGTGTGTTFGAYNTILANNSSVIVSRTDNPGTAATHVLGTLTVSANNTLGVSVGANITSGVAYGVTFAGTTLNANPTFNVANNGAGVGTLLLGALGDGGVARTITKQGTGALTLNTLATGLVAGTQITIERGTINQGATNALGINSPALSITPTAGTGLYNISGAFTQTLGLITMGGASATTANITTGTGTVTMAGNLTYDATSNPNASTISGLLNVGTTQKTFTIGDSSAAADDLTVSAVITNGASGSILKTGAGTLLLSGANTAYTGGIALNQGNLVGTVAGSFGTAASIITLGGGNLELRAAATTFTGGLTMSSSGATITINPASAGAGVIHLISGATSLGGGQTMVMSAGSLTTNNTAYGLTLSGNKTLTGDSTYTINGNGSGVGTLSLITGTINTQGATRTLTLNNGSGSGVNTATISGAFTGTAGTLVLAGSAPVTVSALTTTANAVQVNSSTGGIYTFNGLSTYTGGTTLTAGTLVLDVASTLPTNGPVGLGTLTLAGGTVRAIGTARTVNNVLSITGDTTFGAATFAGVLTLGGAASTTGTRALTFNNTTSVLSGLLTLGGDLTTSGTGGATLSGGIALGGSNRTLTGNTTGATTISGALSSSAGSNKLILTGTGVTVGLVTAGTNNPSIEVNGAGTYTFNAASTYTSGTTLTAGTMVLGIASTGTITNGPVGTGTLTLAGGTVRATASPFAVNNILSITGDTTFGAATFAGALTLGGAASTTGTRALTFNNTTSVLSGVLTLGGDLSTTGTGGATFSGGFGLNGANRQITPGTTGATSIGGPLGSTGAGHTLTLVGTGNATITGFNLATAGTGGIGNQVKTFLSGTAGTEVYTFNGAGTSTGGIELTSGIIALGTTPNVTAGTLTLGNGTTIRSDSATARTLLAATPLAINGSVTFSNATNTGALTFQGSTQQITAANPTLTFATSLTTFNTNPLNLNGNDFTIAKTGAGAVSFNAGLSWTGARTINTGAGSGNVFIQGAMSGTSTPSLTLTGTSTSVFFGNSIAVTGATGGVNVNGPTVTFGVGTSTYTGGTTLTSGTLVLDAASVGAITSGPVGTGTLILAGGTLRAAATNRQVDNVISITGDTTIGAATFAGILTLGGAKTTTGARTVTFNNTTTVLSTGGLTLGGALLMNGNSGATFQSTITTAGNTITFSSTAGTFDLQATAATVTGLGGVTITSGRVNMGGGGTAPVHTYSGDTNITGGVMMFHNNFSANSNININGGIMEAYFGGTWSQTLGSGANQLRITGGNSGFSENGAAGLTVSLGGGTITWGSANFAPTKLILNSSASQAGAALTFTNAINLSGSDRTVVANIGLSNATATLSGVISNSVGTAGLIKEGAGTLTISNGANTFNGHITINAGSLIFSAVASWGTGAKNVTFTGNATLASNTATYTGGILAIGANAAIISGSSLTFASTTGSGSVRLLNSVAGATLNLGDASAFTGNVRVDMGGTTNANPIVRFSALSDTVGSKLQFGGTNGDSNQSTLVQYIGTAPLVFSNRVIEILLPPSSNGPRYSKLSSDSTLAANTWTINTNLSMLSTQSRELELTGTNTGDNTFAGIIGNGSGTISLNKTGAGKWIVSGSNTFTGFVAVGGGTLVLSGTNQYTGSTTITSGTLVASSIKNFGTASSLGAAASGAITTSAFGSSVFLSYVGTGDTSNRTFSFIPYNISDSPAFTLNNDGSGALIFNGSSFNVNSNTASRLFTFTVGGTYTGGTNEIQGTIANYFTGASDTVNLAKAGAGTWKFSGTNTYTGTTSISNGTLAITTLRDVGVGASSLGAPITAANGTISLGSGATAGTLRYDGTGSTSNRVINLAGSTGGASLINEGTGTWRLTGNLAAVAGVKALTLGGSTTGIGEFAGVIGNGSGTTSVTKTGTGTWVLTGANTYGGSTTISAGTLTTKNASALGSGAGRNVTVAAGAGLNYAANGNSALSISGTLGITGGAGTVIGGSIGSSTTGAQITVTGNATATGAIGVNIYGANGVSALAGTNTYVLVKGAGGSTLNGGTYTLGTVFNATNFTVGALSSTADELRVSITDATALTGAFWTGGLAGATNVWAASDGTANSNWFTTASGGATPLVPGSTTDVTISANTITTAPTATVLGASMTIRSLTISDTTNGLGLNADGNTLTIANAAGITMDASVPASTIGANVTLGASQTWTNNSINSLTVSGAVSGAFDLTKAGTGTIILSNNNTFSGTTTVSAGTLTVANGFALQNSALVTTSGTSTYTGASILALGGLSGASGNLGSASVLSGYTGVVNDLRLNVSGTLTYGGVISNGSGAMTLTKSGAGTQILSATNTYTGATTINAGTLRAGAAAGGQAFGSGSAVTLANVAGVTLDLNGFSQTIGSLAGGGATGGNVTLGANATLTTGGNGTSTTFTGVISGTGTSGLIKTGAGTFTLSGANTYTGNTTISGGTLQVGSNTAGTLGSGNYAGNISNSGTLQIWSTAAQTLSGVISGTGTLHKAYGGTLTLSGANTYTGKTFFVPQTNASFTANIYSFNSVVGGSASSSLGAPTTAANGTIDIGSGSAAASINLVYNGTGETTDRILAWSFNAGATQTLTNNGSGLLKFTSAPTLNLSSGTGALIFTGTGNGEFVGAIPTLTSGGLSKTGTGTWTLGGNVTGIIGVSNGLLGFNGTATRTVSGAVTVSSTGGITLQNGAVNTLNLSSTLGITGALGANNLRFDLGNGTGTSDQISVTGTTTVTTTGSAVVNIGQLGGLAGRTATTYTLIGGAGTLDATNFAKFTLATTAAFGQTYALANGGTAGDLQLVTTNVTSATPAAFWAGNTSVNWSAANWKTDLTSDIAAGAPDYETNVTFSTTTPVPANLTTNVLDVDFDINSLTLTDASGNVTIGGTRTLTIEATNANGNTAGNGIDSQKTTGTNTISAKVGLAASQTWTVATGGTLVVSGAITDFGLGNTLTKAGNGTLTLSSAATAYTGPTVISAGTLSLSLASITAAFASPTTVNAGATLRYAPTANVSINSATASVDLQGAMVYNPTGGAANFYQTTNAPVTVNATSTIDLTAGTFAASNGGLYLDGGLKGSSNVTVTSNTNGYGLVLRTTNSTYSGTMTVIGTPSTVSGTGRGLAIGGALTNLSNANLTIDGTLELGDKNTGMGWALGATTGTTLSINALNGSGVVVGNMQTAASTRTLSVGNNGGTGTFSGVIANGTNNTLSFTKTGAGTQTLSGTNTYTGTTTISAGTLNANTTDALGSGASTNTLIFTGGTLQAGGSFTSTATRGVTLTSTGTVDTNGNAVSIAGIMSGTGGLTKSGTGTLTLTGSNTYTGVTTVSDGTLKLNNTAANSTTIVTDGSTATTSDIVINGGTLELAASEQIADSGSINMSSGFFNFGSASGLTETIDKFTNSGGTFVSGANTLIGLGATVTWSGGTNTISSGGYVQDKHWVITGGTNTVNGNGTLRVWVGGGTSGLFFGGTGSPTVTLDSSAGTAGQMLLKQDVTVDATLTSGTAQILSGGALANPGFIDMDGGTRTFTVNDGSAATDMLISAQIQNGGLIKAGAGTLELTGSNTYAGSTTISAGTLNANATDALGDSSSTNTLIFSGGTLQAGGTITSTSSRKVTLTSTGTIDTNSQAVSIAGIMSGTGSYTKSGTGTLTVTGTNTYTGSTTIAAGTLNANASAALGDSSATNTLIFNGGTLQAGGTITSTSSRLVTLTSTGTIDTNGNAVSIAGIISGTGGFTKSGTNTLTLTGVNTYTGATTVSNGNLQVGSSSAGSTVAASVMTVSGSVGSTTAAAANSGVTTTPFTSPPNYTNTPVTPNIVTGPTLSGTGTVNGNTTIGAGTAASAGVLKPGDTGGTVNGTLNFGGTLTVTDLSQIQLKLTSSTQIDALFDPTVQNAQDYLNLGIGANYTSTWSTKAGSYDQILGVSTLTIGTGGVTFGTPSVLITDNAGASYAAGQIFKLLDWSTAFGYGQAGFAGNFDVTVDLALPNLTSSSLQWDTSAFRQYGVVVLVAVPEPGRMMLMFFGLAALFLRRRRK